MSGSLDFDRAVALEAAVHCPRCAASLWRPVLLEHGIARACMCCGGLQLAVTEWSYPENPHVDPQPLGVRLLALDAESEAWLGAFPRVATGADAREGGPHFIPASRRAADEASLAALERAMATAPPSSVGERLRRAGVPAAPPRRDTRHELAPFLAVHDALALDADVPVGTALELAACDTPLAALLANEHLASRSGLLASLASAFEHGTPPRPLVLTVMSRFLPAASPAEIAATCRALATRLAAVLSSPFEHEREIGAILDVLACAGASAAPARDAVILLRESELASRRSTLRAVIERILLTVDGHP